MNKEQILRILKVMIIATFLMFAFDLLFWEGFPISQAIGNFITNVDRAVVWIAIWLIMFLQVAFIPIPALVVLNAILQINIFSKTISMFTESGFWIIMGIIISAYMVGAVVAYLLGYKFGKIAVRYCAGSDEDYEKWSTFLTEKGKWWYAATVILPIFPDDLLCLVAGATKFDFKFFFWSNMVGRSVGLLTMMTTLALFGTVSGEVSSFPVSSLVWGLGMIAEIVIYFVLRQKIKKEKKLKGM